MANRLSLDVYQCLVMCSVLSFRFFFLIGLYIYSARLRNNLSSNTNEYQRKLTEACTKRCNIEFIHQRSDLIDNSNWLYFRCHPQIKVGMFWPRNKPLSCRKMLHLFQKRTCGIVAALKGIVFQKKVNLVYQL